MTVSRRDFVKEAVTAAAVCSMGIGKLAAVTGTGRRSGGITFGYASITWGGRDRQAIDEIAQLGFPGIQLRANVLPEFGDRPEALRELLGQHHLSFVAFSSGVVPIDAATARATIDEHVAHARFVRDAGGRFLQVMDQRPPTGDVTPDMCTTLGALLTEIGRRTADLGVPLVYHPHMGTIGERPDAAARVLDAADARVVKLLLDVAHYQQGGGDPVAAIRRYRDRLSLVHLKDVVSIPTSPGFEFVELGRGRVDLPGVFAALRDVGYSGWAVVELDAVPEPGRSPSDCARESKRYLEAHGFSVS